MRGKRDVQFHAARRLPAFLNPVTSSAFIRELARDGECVLGIIVDHAQSENRLLLPGSQGNTRTALITMVNTPLANDLRCLDLGSLVHGVSCRHHASEIGLIDLRGCTTGISLGWARRPIPGTVSPSGPMGWFVCRVLGYQV